MTAYRIIALMIIAAGLTLVPWYALQDSFYAFKWIAKFGGKDFAPAIIQIATFSKIWLILLPAMLLMTTIGFLGFTVSRALNAEADSSRRATVLSVKGLAFNLAYGLFSFGFSRLLAAYPDQGAGTALRGALFWQVPAFALVTLMLFTWAGFLQKRRA